MFLKRLELHGFKSFADKTELAFVPGITAVVGPNGSGKSNISDSVRWVLGEQSAKSLRGGNMADVIFAGSSARKPVNFGEVSLTLDNKDQRLPVAYEEVTVTRRIHRTGESEYFINKQACRLRDIMELFMDTGVGKEAYSIIGQGRIEEILSTRSEDRRGIFEEASGIVKYKVRKKESQKKLDETEANLLRINDLVVELEGQIEPLRHQSEKAVIFKELKEQLKNSEISLYVHQITEVHQEWKVLNDLLQQVKDREIELSTIVNAHDAHLETDRFAARKLEDEIEALQTQLIGFGDESEKTEVQREVLVERRRNLIANKESLDLSQLTAETKKQQLLEEQVALQAKVSSVETQRAQLSKEIAEQELVLQRLIDAASEENEAKLKQTLLDVVNRLADVRNDVRFVENQRSVQAQRGQKLEADRQGIAQRAAELEKELADVRSQVQAVGEQLTDVQEKYLASVARMKEQQRLFQEADVALRKWQQSKDSLVSRRDTMKELQDDYDGFQHGVREVLKAKNKPNGLQGVHGAVAELVKMPARLEVAVETALGAGMQNIVMENEALARKAIQLLKERHLGRATFLPLDVIKARSIAANDLAPLKSLPGYVGVAADLVQFDAKYSGIVGSLLGNVIFAEKLEDANKIASRGQYRYRVVTLEGDVVNAGGSMTGGSVNKKQSSLLGRGRQLEELEKQIKDAEAQVGALQKQKTALDEAVKSDSQQLESLRQQGEQLRLDEQRQEAEQQRVHAAWTQASEQLQAIDSEVSGIAAADTQKEEQQQQFSQSVLDLQAEEQQLHVAIREAEETRRDSLSRKDDEQQAWTQLKMKLAATEQEANSLDEQLQRAEAALDEHLTMMANAIEQQGRFDEVAAAIDEEMARLTERHNAIKIERATCSEQLEFKRADRAKIVARIEREEGETKEQRQALRQVEEQLRQTEVKVNRLDVELDNLLRKLAEEYELSYELASERYPLPEDLQATQQLVRDLKRKIAALGEVNLGAIEEYSRVSERFTFLSKQKDDLVEAKQALYSVIKELEAEMAKLFTATFEEIRGHFGHAFSKLFGGGRADLVLVDPEHPLETGIDIVAQPPGKKLQNLQLLSGGERALTAIALLFAILHVKPVPFCILDEVEAALDEANVSRFAQYLREFSFQTQFIVVTHRKGTMEEADVLYGVAMEEGGVSKLVSVRLEDEQSVIA
jgi:chromosome segregation protein